jgi:hypothetical protein
MNRFLQNKSFDPFFRDEKNRRWLYIGTVALLLIAGLLIRIKALRDFRSLWGDEACLAMNILTRDFGGLAQPLSYFQAAPLLYLWVVKAFSLTLGEGEEALRLTSWLGGLAILPLVFLLARRFFKRWGTLFALFLAVISPSLIRYAIELKQYSSDALISALLLLLGIAFLRGFLPQDGGGPSQDGGGPSQDGGRPSQDGGRQRWWEVIVLALVGAAAVWASHPAIFTLAGIGLTWLIACLRQHKKIEWVKAGVLALAWLASFAAYYFFQLAGLRQSDYLQSFWAFGYPPLPTSWENVFWYLKIPLQLFDITPASPFLGAAGLFIVLGGLAWLRSGDAEAWLFLIPTALTLLAAALHGYPFGQRLILFLFPSGLVLLVKGIETVAQNLQRGRRLFLVAAIFFVSIFPFAQAVDPSLRVFKLEELSPIVNYVRSNWQANDTMYVYYGGTCSFRYYARLYKLPADWYTIGSLDEARAASDRKAYLARQYQAYAGRPRVWVVFTHDRDDDLRDSLEILNGMGKVLFSETKPGSSLYLYDFSGAAPK